MRTSGDLKPGVPARGAVWLFLIYKHINELKPS